MRGSSPSTTIRSAYGRPSMDKTLWKSRTLENYRDNMLPPASENRDYAVKPMIARGMCRFSTMVCHSYRDLPLRPAEFGSCHRNESSGSLHGLMRVRDLRRRCAYFCTEEQVQAEVSSFIVMLNEVYRDFGLH